MKWIDDASGRKNFPFLSFSRVKNDISVSVDCDIFSSSKNLLLALSSNEGKIIRDYFRVYFVNGYY